MEQEHVEILLADEINHVDPISLAKREAFDRAVKEGKDEDFSDLDALLFWDDEGEDRDGGQIIRIVGNYFPADTVSTNRLRRYIFRKVHNLLEMGPQSYTILYIHTEAWKRTSSSSLLPIDARGEGQGRGGGSGRYQEFGWFWLRDVYESIPTICRHRIRAVLALHPAAAMRFGLWAMSPWLSDGLYSKITFFSRVEFLWDCIDQSEVDIPEFVIEHDKELEGRPLMDYGFEIDPELMSHHLIQVNSLSGK